MLKTARAWPLAAAFSLILVWPGVTRAQDKAAFDPVQVFAPLTLPEAVNSYRSGSGAPGPAYWQNRADYAIQAVLDPDAKVLTAEETITYVNNSPDALEGLWLQLDQNIYRKDSRASVGGGARRTGFTDGYALDAVAVEQGGKFQPVTPVVSDTRMRVALPSPLSRGGHVRLQIRYHYTVPGLFGGRTAWVATKGGDIFDIAQWFPRMAVYDDIRGWDTSPFLGSEFYLEYGDIDYSVTVPSDMLVAGTGVLVNPNEVLTPLERARLAQAAASDKTVMIRSPDEVADPVSRPKQGGTLTWRFHMHDTRDVAFSASKAFVWDAARINLPGGKTALAESFYPAESAGDAAWGRSTEYLKDAVERFSGRWAPYPYATAINVAGGAAGMEYPGMAFDGIDDKGKKLFWITAHEIGHTWFPMMVGSDERRYSWMDEGINTFIDTYESDDFEGGVYAPKRDTEYGLVDGNPADSIQKVLADPTAPPIMSRPDAMPFRLSHPVYYFKTALGLRLLREQILGPDRFDPAFRKYIRDWSFKHPKPSDFFRTLESEGGEDLGWFWREWFFENWNLDLAVEGVSYVDGDPAKGAQVTVSNLDRMVMPSVLEVRYGDGTTERIALPVETWMQKGRVTLRLPGHGPIASATIDPDHVLPDKDRANNIFTPPAPSQKS